MIWQLWNNAVGGEVPEFRIDSYKSSHWRTGVCPQSAWIQWRWYWGHRNWGKTYLLFLAHGQIHILLQCNLTQSHSDKISFQCSYIKICCMPSSTVRTEQGLCL